MRRLIVVVALCLLSVCGSLPVHIEVSGSHDY